MINPELRKTLGDDEYVRILSERLKREQDVIRAIQHRITRCLGPVEFFWRKPWKSSVRPSFSRQHSFRTNLLNLYGWARYAHDCSDPAVGCSCYGGFRFPKEEEEGRAR